MLEELFLSGGGFSVESYRGTLFWIDGIATGISLFVHVVDFRLVRLAGETRC